MATGSVVDGPTTGAKTSKERETSPRMSPVQRKDCIPLETNEAGSAYFFFGKALL